MALNGKSRLVIKQSQAALSFVAIKGVARMLLNATPSCGILFSIPVVAGFLLLVQSQKGFQSKLNKMLD